MHSGMHWPADGLNANLALSCYMPTGVTRMPGSTVWRQPERIPPQI